jgi:hypothetical protein
MRAGPRFVVTLYATTTYDKKKSKIIILFISGKITKIDWIRLELSADICIIRT